MDELDDIVATTTASFLALTVACARCHDHKADPIPTEDYYRLVAVFAPGEFADVPLATAEEQARHREASQAVEAEVQRLQREIQAIDRTVRDRAERQKLDALPETLRRAFETGDIASLSRDEQQELARATEVRPEEVEHSLTPKERQAKADGKAKIAAVEATRPPPLPMAPGVVEQGPEAPPTHVLIRGDVERKGETVPPGPPRAVAGQVVDFPDAPPRAPSTLRRSALAWWITRDAQALAARVVVNRIWQGHFGRGLVETPSDFGAMGAAPAMPELLDWLAGAFLDDGWSRKAIHRRIVLSATYRQASRIRPDMRERDPENILLWRFAPRRLEAEAIRDAILWCAGSLNPTLGGPGVFPPIDPAVVRQGSEPRWPLDATEGPETWRRSLYIFQLRSVPFPLLEVFDLPESAGSCPRRSRTTTPTQSLTLWNNPFVLDQARRFALRVAREAGDDPERPADPGPPPGHRPPARRDRARDLDRLPRAPDRLACRKPDPGRCVANRAGTGLPDRRLPRLAQQQRVSVPGLNGAEPHDVPGNAKECNPTRGTATPASVHGRAIPPDDRGRRADDG